jgi:hypothetical protein
VEGGGVSKTVNGKAAVCHWDLTLTFIDKDQAVHVVSELMKRGVDFPVSYRPEMTNTSMIHIVEIDDMAWAHNLAAVAEIVLAIDYDAAPTQVGAA